MQPKGWGGGGKDTFQCSTSLACKAKPLESVNSRLAGNSEAIGEARQLERVRDERRFMGLSNHDRNDRMYASWTFFRLRILFPASPVPLNVVERAVHRLHFFETWKNRGANFKEEKTYLGMFEKSWDFWNCCLHQSEQIGSIVQLTNFVPAPGGNEAIFWGENNFSVKLCQLECEMKLMQAAGKGGLVGGRKAEICSFRCLPKKVQAADFVQTLWRQLSFQLIHSLSSASNNQNLTFLHFQKRDKIIFQFPKKIRTCLLGGWLLSRDW